MQACLLYPTQNMEDTSHALLVKVLWTFEKITFVAIMEVQPKTESSTDNVNR